MAQQREFVSAGRQGLLSMEDLDQLHSFAERLCGVGAELLRPVLPYRLYQEAVLHFLQLLRQTAQRRSLQLSKLQANTFLSLLEVVEKNNGRVQSLAELLQATHLFHEYIFTSKDAYLFDSWATLREFWNHLLKLTDTSNGLATQLRVLLLLTCHWMLAKTQDAQSCGDFLQYLHDHYGGIFEGLPMFRDCLLRCNGVCLCGALTDNDVGELQWQAELWNASDICLNSHAHSGDDDEEDEEEEEENEEEEKN
jgi:hypothetical protein